MGVRLGHCLTVRVPCSQAFVECRIAAVFLVVIQDLTLARRSPFLMGGNLLGGCTLKQRLGINAQRRLIEFGLAIDLAPSQRARQFPT